MEELTEFLDGQREKRDRIFSISFFKWKPSYLLILSTEEIMASNKVCFLLGALSH